MTTSNKVALLVGAGDAIGAAVARRFARGGFTVCVARREAAKSAALLDEIQAAGGQAHAFSVDARSEEAVQSLFQDVEQRIGPIEVCLFNAGSNVNKPILETSQKLFFKAWELACCAGFLVGREAASHMIKRGHGTMLFTGATASLRGRDGMSAFAGAKHALRALAQSMARELGPRGVHVAHVVVDGAIDTDFIRENFPERYALKAQDGILNPEHIAENYWMLHRQPRDAWTHELDLRPYGETW